MKKLWIVTFISILFLSGLVDVNASNPSYHMHTVKDGETYWTISQRYSRSINHIQSLNTGDPQQLKVGDLVRINAIQSIKVNVNNRAVQFDRQPYIEQDRVFVPLRFIAEALKVDDIKWLQDSLTAQIYKGNQVIEVTRGSKVARVNGVQVLLDAPVQLYEDRTFVPLRFFSEAFGTNEVQWNPASYTVNINSSGTQSANTSQSVLYSEEDFYWLSRIIHAEAEGEPYSGKLAVANVIINRKNSPEFPNTIKGVIFDNNFGIQFTPVANGKIYNRPNAESERAAIEALEGHNNIGNSLYFLNPIMATNHWITINRSFYTRIGGHYFYI